MDNTLSQRRNIGNYLKAHPGVWVNKLKLREISLAEDVPTRVWELINKENWHIGSRKSKINKFQEYTYIDSPKPPKKPEYVIINGRGRLVEEPSQMSF